VKLGDSIAVNGICLTVVDFNNISFTAEVMAETLTKTNLGDLKPEVKVNLERALRLCDRVGGHLVSGHVDGVGIITRQTRHDIALVSEISYPEEIGKYLIPKGSIAIDGISLTVVNVTSTVFTVSLIPHTRGITSLGLKKVGDKVNLEADVIAKYLEQLVQPSEKTVDPRGIKLSFLSQHGFL
jgi:riboflavin synthase